MLLLGQTQTRQDNESTFERTEPFFKLNSQPRILVNSKAYTHCYFFPSNEPNRLPTVLSALNNCSHNAIKCFPKDVHVFSSKAQSCALTILHCSTCQLLCLLIHFWKLGFGTKDLIDVQAPRRGKIVSGPPCTMSPTPAIQE